MKFLNKQKITLLNISFKITITLIIYLYTHLLMSLLSDYL